MQFLFLQGMKMIVWSLTDIKEMMNGLKENSRKCWGASVPDYLRKSQAEREMEEKEQQA